MTLLPKLSVYTEKLLPGNIYQGLRGYSPGASSSYPDAWPVAAAHGHEAQAEAVRGPPSRPQVDPAPPC